MQSSTLQQAGTVVALVAGVATLLYLERKRRGIVGDSCSITDDCQTGTHCVDNKCVPLDPTTRG